MSRERGDAKGMGERKMQGAVCVVLDRTTGPGRSSIRRLDGREPDDETDIEVGL